MGNTTNSRDAPSELTDSKNQMQAIDGNHSRRVFLAASIGSALVTGRIAPAQTQSSKKALIAITLDLEMSREYPRRGLMEWDYEKGNLDEATKRYAVEAARVAQENGGKIHFFCVGRVLEQPNVDWLKEIASAGHPIGNHTYDHIYLLAKTTQELQFRFQRAPWLIEGREVHDVIRQNIAWTSAALQQRAGIKVNGFRTPGGFQNGLNDRVDLQHLLLESGFSWVSSKYPAHLTGKPREEPTDHIIADIVRAQAAAQPFTYPSGLIEVPMSPISDIGAFRTNYWKLPWFLRAVEAGVRWAIDHNAVFDLLAHPSCMTVEDPEFQTIKLICRLVREAGDRAQIVGLDTIAAASMTA